VCATLDDLVTALYVTVDELVEPCRGPGCRPRLSDAELLCLAVAQVLLGYDSERRWLRAVADRLGHLFPYVCGQAAYNRRLRRAAPLVAQVLHALAVAAPSWCDQWRLLDATPVPCGTSRETVKRSQLAGWAGYGWDASYHRFWWGLKLYLLAAPDGMPVAFCLANPNDGEREVAEALLDRAARQGVLRPGMVVLADKGWLGASSTRSWASWARPWPGRTGPMSPTGSARWVGCGSGWRRSSTPSRTSSAWNATALTPSKVCGSGSRSGCWPCRRGLVQLAARRPGQALPGRLRPLRPHPSNRHQSSRGFPRTAELRDPPGVAQAATNQTGCAPIAATHGPRAAL
jgi:hypothetical protein